MLARLGVVFAITCLWFRPAAAEAQQRVAVFSSRTPTIIAAEVATPAAIQQEQQTEMKPEEQMSTSGFFLGIVSMIGGAAIASSVGQNHCPTEAEDKECMNRYAYTGALMAGTAMAPLGVYLAAKKKHGLLQSYALAAVTGTALYYGMRAIPGKPIAMAPFVALPLDIILSVRAQKQP